MVCQHFVSALTITKPQELLFKYTAIIFLTITIINNMWMLNKSCSINYHFAFVLFCLAFCCYGVMLLCCYVVMMLCCYVVILLLFCFALLFVVMLLCCYVVMLSFCFCFVLLCFLLLWMHSKWNLITKIMNSNFQKFILCNTSQII